MFIGAAVAIYLLPTLIAVARRSRWSATIAEINVVLGWTIVGWIWAAAMAVDNTPRRALRVIPGDAPSTIADPYSVAEQGMRRRTAAASRELHVVEPPANGSRADVA